MNREEAGELIREAVARALAQTPQKCTGAALEAAAAGAQLKVRVDGQGDVWAINATSASIVSGDRVVWEWIPPRGSVVTAKW